MMAGPGQRYPEERADIPKLPPLRVRLDAGGGQVRAENGSVFPRTSA